MKNTKICIIAIAVSCIICCVTGQSYGQLNRAATQSFSIAPKRLIKVGRVGRTIKIIPQAKNLQPDIGGTFIILDFETNVTANALVTLEKVSGPLPPGTESFKWTGAGVDHRVQFVNLEADTDYKIQVDVIPTEQLDGPAPQSTVYPFKTLQRHVFVALNDVFVYDDADWDNAGDLSFGVQIGHQHANFNDAGNSWDFLNFKTYIDSGTGVNLAQSGMPNYLYQNDVQSTTLKIAVSANERDYAIGHFSFRPDLVDRYLGSGTDAYNEWNSGFILIDIGHSNLTPGGNSLHQKESLVRNFEIDVPSTGGVDLSYTLSGQLVVAYW